AIGQCVDNLSGAVRRVVVDDQHLEPRILRERRRDDPLDIGLFVVRRHDHERPLVLGKDPCPDPKLPRRPKPPHYAAASAGRSVDMPVGRPEISAQASQASVTINIANVIFSPVGNARSLNWTSTVDAPAGSGTPMSV